MAPYPTKSEIDDMFEGLASGNNGLFFDNVVDDVDWTVMGHSPMGGNYRSKQEFREKTMGLLNSKVLKEKLTMRVKNVVGGGEDSFAAVELEADSVCRNGEARLGPLGGNADSGGVQGSRMI